MCHNDIFSWLTCSQLVNIYEMWLAYVSTGKHLTAPNWDFYQLAYIIYLRKWRNLIGLFVSCNHLVQKSDSELIQLFIQPLNSKIISKWDHKKYLRLGRHLLRQPKLFLAQMPPYGIQYKNKTILNYNINSRRWYIEWQSVYWMLTSSARNQNEAYIRNLKRI